MLNDELTKKNFGYEASVLALGSKKSINVVCDYLGDLGFVQKSCHLSFKWTNTRYTYHRMKFPSNTGYEQGMNKIWDCGQAKWVKYAGKE
jgi:hypothetical protein